MEEALLWVLNMSDGDHGLLDIAEPYPIPVLYGLFRHAGHRDASPGANEALFDQARLRFGHGYAFDKPELERLAVSQKPVYIWGLAYRTLMQCAMSPLRHCRIRGFLDADPRKQALTLRGGEAIRSPELLAKADSDATVVIGVGPSADRMRELLAGMGASLAFGGAPRLSGSKPMKLNSQQESAAGQRYDLLIRGGRVVDPSQELDAVRDVAIAGGKIAQIEANIPSSQAREVINADESGLLRQDVP